MNYEWDSIHYGAVSQNTSNSEWNESEKWLRLHSSFRMTRLLPSFQPNTVTLLSLICAG